MIPPIDLSQFADRTYYTQHFMDPVFWEPYVRRICQRHGFSCEAVKPGVPGTFPTFIVEAEGRRDQGSSGEIVVKMFGPLFEGEDSYHTERELSHWLEAQPMLIPSPRILAEGRLEQGWWYLVFEYVDGVTLGEVRGKLTGEDLSAVAEQMGHYMHQLHVLSAEPHHDLPGLLKPSTEEYTCFLQDQHKRLTMNHTKWKDLPEEWLEQLESFVLPIEQLVDFSAAPHLIHADLTADHLLGTLEDGRWKSHAIIDWGDARSGNILYELVALHLDLFQGDKSLLQCCIEAYDLPGFYRHDFPRKALSMVLLHQFPMPARVYEPYLGTPSLHILAERMFAI